MRRTEQTVGWYRAGEEAGLQVHNDANSGMIPGPEVNVRHPRLAVPAIRREARRETTEREV